MARSSTMRIVAMICLLVSTGSGYLLYVDRQTPFALHLVELQSMAPVPIPGLLAIIGTLMMGLSLRGQSPRPSHRVSRNPPFPTRSKPSQSAPLPKRTTPTSSTSAVEQSDKKWTEHLRESCNEITLPPGARITLDHTRPCPIVLHLEMAPPERCKRAIRSVASWFARYSIPPRFRIVFDHCPDGSSPRHHMVNGALAHELERGAFKVISDRDSVDVLFHRPDPRWKNPQAIG